MNKHEKLSKKFRYGEKVINDFGRIGIVLEYFIPRYGYKAKSPMGNGFTEFKVKWDDGETSFEEANKLSLFFQ